MQGFRGGRIPSREEDFAEGDGGARIRLRRMVFGRVVFAADRRKRRLPHCVVSVRRRRLRRDFLCEVHPDDRRLGDGRRDCRGRVRDGIGDHSDRGCEGRREPSGGEGNGAAVGTQVHREGAFRQGDKDDASSRVRGEHDIRHADEERNLQRDGDCHHCRKGKGGEDPEIHSPQGWRDHPRCRRLRSGLQDLRRRRVRGRQEGVS